VPKRPITYVPKAGKHRPPDKHVEQKSKYKRKMLHKSAETVHIALFNSVQILKRCYGCKQIFSKKCRSHPNDIVVQFFCKRNYHNADGIEAVSPQVQATYFHTFLRCIVESNREEFAERLLVDSLALSLRCDGSVDRTQTDKLFVMIKPLDANSEEHLYFLGADEPAG